MKTLRIPDLFSTHIGSRNSILLTIVCTINVSGQELLTETNDNIHLHTVKHSLHTVSPCMMLFSTSILKC